MWDEWEETWEDDETEYTYYTTTHPYEGKYSGFFLYTYYVNTYTNDGYWQAGPEQEGKFELTIKLDYIAKADGTVALYVTYARCDDPYFGCVMGCTLENTSASAAALPSERPANDMNPSQAGHGIAIEFPNGTVLATSNNAGDLSVLGYTNVAITLSNNLDLTISWFANDLNGSNQFPQGDWSDTRYPVITSASWKLVKSIY